MKIEHVQIDNFLGLNSAKMELGPVTLVGGNNGAGKTSLVHAIKFALTGEVSRVSELKKDREQLIKHGAQSSSVTVAGEGFKCARQIPAKVENAGLPYPALPFLIDPSLFASLDEKARRRFLFELTGVKVDADSVREKLLDRGVNPSIAEKILPMLRAGFPEACAKAKTLSSENRGAWKAITGENYGSVKADSWQATTPEQSADAGEAARVIEQTDQHIQQVMNEIANVRRTLADLETEANIRFNLEREIKKHEGNDARLKDALAVASEKAKNLEELRIAAGNEPENLMACPHCAGAVFMQGDVLTAFESGQSDKKAKKLIPAAEKELSDAQAAVAVLKNSVAAREAAAKKLVDRPFIEPVDETVLVSLEADLDELRKVRAQAEKDKQEAAMIAAKAAQAEQQTAQARDYHEAVKQWSLVEAAFAPDGIPGEILASALEPINNRLRQSAHSTEWLMPVIAADMTITGNGKAYNLLSESEKWRVDAMIAEAIALLSGLQIIVLDRFDVLDIPSRGALVRWMLNLAASGQIQTAIIVGTVKLQSLMTNDRIQSYWIDNGVMSQVKAASDECEAAA